MPAAFVAGRKAWSASELLWKCTGRHRETSVAAGAIFRDSRLPLTLWFRAVWWVTSQKNGVSAMGVQRVLGLKSYKTARKALDARDRFANSQP